MGLSRRQFIKHAAAAGLIAASPYDRIDHLIDAARRRPPSSRTSPSHQHAFLSNSICSRDLSRVVDNDTVVTVPPLHHMVVTAMLTVPLSDPALQEAQSTLESTLRGLEESGLLTFTPSGLGLAVAWGLPYFDALPPAVSEAWLPVDLVTSNETGQTTLAILNAITFASDPPGTILEQNDVAFVMASDYLEHIKTAFDTVFNGPVGELMSITSIRRGFVDGAAMGSGRRSLTKTMALEADIPGAKAIPEFRRIVLGFHLHPARRSRAFGDRQLRGTTRGHQPVAERILLERDDDAPLPPVRRPRSVVRRLHAATGGFRLPTSGGGKGDVPDHHPPRRARARRLAGEGRVGIQPLRVHRSLVVDATLVAPVRSGDRQLRNDVPSRNRSLPARRLQHARQPVRLQLRYGGRPRGLEPGRWACTSWCSCPPALPSTP